jgi:hypothetical protein
MSTDFCVGLDVPAFAAALAAGILPPKDPILSTRSARSRPFRLCESLGVQRFLAAC